MHVEHNFGKKEVEVLLQSKQKDEITALNGGSFGGLEQGLWEVIQVRDMRKLRGQGQRGGMF